MLDAFNALQPTRISPRLCQRIVHCIHSQRKKYTNKEMNMPLLANVLNNTHACVMPGATIRVKEPTNLVNSTLRAMIHVTRCGHVASRTFANILHTAETHSAMHRHILLKVIPAISGSRRRTHHQR